MHTYIPKDTHTHAPIETTERNWVKKNTTVENKDEEWRREKARKRRQR